MITKANDEFPEIEWEDLKTELLESDPEERMKIYIAIGIDKDGKEYKGNAIFICDELEKIEHIEEC
jgi:hypothetical protein